MNDLNRAHFEQLDKHDVLGPLRAQFHLPENLVYLDGNSLGPLPLKAARRAREVVELEWGDDLIRSWNVHQWVDVSTRIGDQLAPLIGAAAGEVLVCDSTSVNLFKLAAAALRMRPERTRVLSERGNFPTDLHILQGLQEFHADDARLVTVDRDQVVSAIDENTALVVLTHVHYKTGAMWDMVELTQAAHRFGALVLWDLSHSTGAVPVALNDAKADMAVGCGYKYLNGGPGAPAYLYVAERHQQDLRNPLSGWFGHAAPFAFEDEYRPAEGIARMQCGTPGVIASTILESALEAFQAVDLQQLRDKSMQLSDLFIRLLDQKCPELELASPRDAQWRGSHLAFRHVEAYAITQALGDRGVIGDFREPDVMRFGFAPLYTRFIDVYDAVAALQDIMEREEWARSQYQNRLAVT